MTKQVRVRFAPSPTGPLHIGGVRTALFNYLFAKKNNGVFYLRIEDTDQTRFVPGAEEYIMESLAWLGISPDETVGKNEKFGPYRQSERKTMYAEYAQQLLDKGKAYYAFDLPEELDAQRKAHEAEGKTFIYNWHNRNQLNNSLSLSPEEVTAKIKAGEPYVIRFKMYSPDQEDAILETTDIIRGEVSFKKELLDDKILYKSDGMPTYHLANIVDDHLMETSHVIRGEEWLPSLPLHIALYNAFGWEQPEFAHLPLILKPVGNGKLSKRDGDKLGFPVFPLEWKAADGSISSGYREQGFFPEAVVNFLALLGWNDGTEQELFSLNQLEELFDLSRVNKSGAKFDPEKNKWFNHQYLQQKSNTELAELFFPIATQHTNTTVEKLIKVIGLVKERANFITDLWSLSDYFFIAPDSFDEKASKKQWKADTATILTEVKELLSSTTAFDSATTEANVKAWLTEKELGFGKVMPPLRLAIVGEMKGPHLFDIIEIIGKEETLNRINFAITTLG